MAGIRRPNPPGDALPHFGPPYNPGMAADPAPQPVVDFISSRSPLSSSRGPLSATMKAGAPVVSRVPDRTGEIHEYEVDAVVMAAPKPAPVWSSDAQPVQLGPIVNYSIITSLRRAGFPISGALLRVNPGWSPKVAHPVILASGPGPVQTHMRPRPRFSRV